ncbi:hypothetical protein L202_00356 [Cryptococcus amylolentus CBS 6039]|uniref:Copper acquisition factor BIM1-like domain-containing protein n=1 Tax=Cryptococcus amylolentus CBS 6039 TaxID=1295533 RepID=A0A1E3I6Y1_9TREE|nr:hypothetical protein L202_00356 [Cryptococcus amylolentus CBS 6039]ODN84399.1 hypothetical protein L202_00356 [Cryptococcus amylolentus CBS 6039]
MLAVQTLLASSLMASTALAHFTLDYPTTRGFDEDKESDFCGGFTSVSSRQPFPLGSGPVHIDSHHTLATVVAFISTSENPSSFDDFNTTSNGTSIPLASSIFQVAEGERCFNIDLGSLVGLTNGSDVTLQIQYDGVSPLLLIEEHYLTLGQGDGNLYQCADLTLIDGYEIPSNETCTTDASKASNASATSSGAASATSSASTDSSSSSGGHKGIVGFGIMSVAMGLAGLTLL